MHGKLEVLLSTLRIRVSTRQFRTCNELSRTRKARCTHNNSIQPLRKLLTLHITYPSLLTISVESVTVAFQTSTCRICPASLLLLSIQSHLGSRIWSKYIVATAFDSPVGRACTSNKHVGISSATKVSTTIPKDCGQVSSC